MDKLKEIHQLLEQGRGCKEDIERTTLQIQLALMDHARVCKRADKRAEEEQRLRIHTLVDKSLDLMWRAHELLRQRNKLTGN